MAARSGLPLMVATLAMSVPCRSRTSRRACVGEVIVQEANRLPLAGAEGSVAPGATSPSGVPSGLISQTSVLSFAPDGDADPLGAAPGPAWPAGRVTSNCPAPVQVPLRMVPESASRLSWPNLTVVLLNDGGSTGGMGARTVVKCTTTGAAGTGDGVVVAPGEAATGAALGGSWTG